MKQLLDTCSSSSSDSTLLITALNDHAYAILTTISSTKTPNMYKLEPTSPTIKTNIRKSTKTNDLSNTIQAVACTVSKQEKICAVSRLDKSIELYSLPNHNNNNNNDDDDEKDEGEETTVVVKSMKMYKTGKRACSLTFAQVPGEEEEEEENMDIIIAADLAGDVTAFPIFTEHNNNNNNNKNNNTNENDSTVSRLLLGHTASMLTGVHIISSSSSSKQQKIITSDRDEKIRISSFPDTFVVEGYCLGHSAYVSAIDAAVNGSNTCVSCGGDGTVRLWDLEEFRQIGIIEGVLKEEEEEESGDDDDDDDDDEEEKENGGEDEDKGNNVNGEKEVKEKENAESKNDDNSNGKKEEKINETDSNDENNFLIPFGISLSPNATKFAVIRQGTFFLDIYSITTSSSSKKTILKKSQSIPCPSQPLAVKFLTNDLLYILTSEPTYLQCYTSTPSSSPSSSFLPNPSSPICTALQKIASNAKITMPKSVLETDAKGQIKLNKTQQKPAFEQNEKMWNNSERLLTAKKRAARRRKRRRGDN